MENEVKKPKLKIARTIYFAAACIMIIFMFAAVVFISVTDNNSAVSVFGYSFYSINSGSMEPVLYVNDVIIVNAAHDTEEASDYQVGDIIVYESFAEESRGYKITHRIVEIDGEGRYIVKGDNNSLPDEPVYPSQVLGKYAARIAGFNYFVTFLRSTWGFILLIVLPSLVLIFLEILNFLRLYKKYKAEQKAESDKEKEEINTERRLLIEEREKAEAERAEAARILEEVKKLKDEMALMGKLPESGEGNKAP